MSEQEKQGSGAGKDGSAIVMVEQTASHVKPYRPTDLQQGSDVHHKRSKAPAVPSVTEELKILAEDTTTNQEVESMELKESDRAMSSEHKYKVSTKSSKRRDSSPEINLPPLRPISADTTKDNLAAKTVQKPFSTQPIPPQIQEEKSEPSVMLDQSKLEEDSIMEEITELQTPEDAKKHSEWSDEEEAGGLPRSESRASRVSRAVRQLLCCGVRYEAASEDNISTRSGVYHAI